MLCKAGMPNSIDIVDELPNELSIPLCHIVQIFAREQFDTAFLCPLGTPGDGPRRKAEKQRACGQQDVLRHRFQQGLPGSAGTLSLQ